MTKSIRMVLLVPSSAIRARAAVPAAWGRRGFPTRIRCGPIPTAGSFTETKPGWILDEAHAASTGAVARAAGRSLGRPALPRVALSRGGGSCPPRLGASARGARGDWPAALGHGGVLSADAPGPHARGGAGEEGGGGWRRGMNI